MTTGTLTVAGNNITKFKENLGEGIRVWGAYSSFTMGIIMLTESVSGMPVRGADGRSWLRPVCPGER